MTRTTALQALGEAKSFVHTHSQITSKEDYKRAYDLAELLKIARVEEFLSSSDVVESINICIKLNDLRAHYRLKYVEGSRWCTEHPATPEEVFKYSNNLLFNIKPKQIKLSL